MADPSASRVGMSDASLAALLASPQLPQLDANAMDRSLLGVRLARVGAAAIVRSGAGGANGGSARGAGLHERIDPARPFWLPAGVHDDRLHWRSARANQAVVRGRRAIAAVLALAALVAGAAAGAPHPNPLPAGERESAARATLTIAAAANVKQALDELVTAFRKEHPGTQVNVSYGSSGRLFAQIVSGAPFDLFLSADEEYPRKLVDTGAAVAESLTPYAAGRLVLWVPKESPLDAAQGLAALRDARARRVAIANPQHAPYGRAAEAALRAAGLLDQVQDRLVLAENVAQAAQFAESGNADAALLPLSLALAPALTRGGKHAVLPETLHPPLLQAAVVTRHGRRNLAAAGFLRFLVGREGRAILDRWGYAAPGR
jgi:molybdate transport system substrate-binding protein